MKILYGTTSNLLRVNLSDGAVKRERLQEDTLQTYLGGKCLGAKILYEELEPGIDPLGPENKLVFAAGPLTGAPFAGHSRYVVMGKSPLTGGWGESHAAGFFGPELKYAGYDAIVIEGRAEKPVYLWIRDGVAELRDATGLWGLVTGDVQAAIRRAVGDEKTRVASIGPGGENLVKYASIMSDLYCAAGRCGMGTIMGSKRLKAVAVRGPPKVPIADEEAFTGLLKTTAESAMTGWGTGMFEHGTGGDLAGLHYSGRLPTKAFLKGTFDGSEKITGQTLTQTILKDRATCPDCPDFHYRIVETSGRYTTNPMYGGPEYETLASFGSLCLNDDLEAIAKANELCNKYSLDTIATGVTLAFAMECYEKGVITTKDTDGIDLSWGNGDAIIAMIPKIAMREGLGDVLAEGVKRAAETLGGESATWALHVKGAELPMHEPRGKKGVGLTYATSDRGASHLQVYHDDAFESEANAAPEIGIDSSLIPQSRTETGPRKVKLVKISEDLMALYNSLVICRFVFYPAGVPLQTLTGLFKSVTGWDASPMELLRVGERSFNLTRAFNAREGFTREDDALPQRVRAPLPDGALKGEAYPQQVLDEMLDLYYDNRGWDRKRGWPARKKLNELDLGWVADDLSKRGLL
ncbi:MAG: aldehyde ferredoxin oxidoreductase family protein [Candidatus Bathyarchaeota archaeon]|nr:aldehyde ferredoxin oxidoreductase family protein [Candidatus Bathyarchaeota archaeon]